MVKIGFVGFMDFVWRENEEYDRADSSEQTCKVVRGGVKFLHDLGGKWKYTIWAGNGNTI